MLKYLLWRPRYDITLWDKTWESSTGSWVLVWTHQGAFNSWCQVFDTLMGSVRPVWLCNLSPISYFLWLTKLSPCPPLTQYTTLSLALINLCFLEHSCAVLQKPVGSRNRSFWCWFMVSSCEGTSASQNTPEPIDFWGLSSWLERSADGLLIRCCLQSGNCFFNHSCSQHGFKNMTQLWSWPQGWVNSDLSAVFHFFGVKRLFSF